MNIHLSLYPLRSLLTDGADTTKGFRLRGKLPYMWHPSHQTTFHIHTDISDFPEYCFLLSQVGPQSHLRIELRAAPMNLSALILELNWTCHPRWMVDHNSFMGYLSLTIFAFQHTVFIIPLTQKRNLEISNTLAALIGERSGAGDHFSIAPQITALTCCLFQFNSIQQILISLTVKQALSRKSHLTPSPASFYWAPAVYMATN